MGTGEGKGWARGKTAATDARVASAAQAHRGLIYVRRTPIELCRWRGPQDASRRRLELGWSPVMAYVVGLLATDGCLISDGRHLNFKSEDEQLVLTLLECLGRPKTYQKIRGRSGNTHYVAQFGDVALYRWLEGIGLTPRKSLTIAALRVPDELLGHCARGLLDGDGSLVHYWYEGSGKAAGKSYEGFTTRFISASHDHIEWLREALASTAGVLGIIGRPHGPHGCWSLNFAIRSSTTLLPRLYPDDDVPKLERKWRIWKDYATSHGYPATLAEQARISDPIAVAARDERGRFRQLSLRERAGLWRIAS